MAHKDSEIRYLQKFVVRVLQIISFFAHKCKHYHLLFTTLNKIYEQLVRAVNTVPIDVEWLFSWVIGLAKNGFGVKKTVRKQRLSLNKIASS
jgi:hypothetical protein